jgi:UDP-glucose 4-epimerase
LADRGFTVLGLGHGIWSETDLCRYGITQWINGDITSNSLNILQKAHGTPELIFHLAGGSSVGAAVASPREDFFRTVATTMELLDWMRLVAPDSKLVAISSAAVYGSGHSGQIAEQATLNPYSPYGYHKRMMEELCRSYAASYGTKVVIARFFSVYGCGLKKQLLWDLCTRLSAGAAPLILGGTGEELRDWTDVRDVVRALAKLEDQASSAVPIFNVGSGNAVPVRQVASLLAKHWAAGSQPVALSFNGQARKGDPFSLVAEPSGLCAMGFEWSVELDQGLADYVKWFRRQEAGQL